jgi:hypothetical protein
MDLLGEKKCSWCLCSLSLSLSLSLSGIGFLSDFQWWTFYVQVGASLCLARVIDCTKDPQCTATLQQLCPRIVKLLSSPSFLANASLLPAVAGLAQVGVFLSLIFSFYLSEEWYSSRFGRVFQISDWRTIPTFEFPLTSCLLETDNQLCDIPAI